MKNYKKYCHCENFADDAAVSADKQSPDSGVRTRLPRALCALAMTALLITSAPAKVCIAPVASATAYNSASSGKLVTEQQLRAGGVDSLSIRDKVVASSNYGLSSRQTLYKNGIVYISLVISQIQARSNADTPDTFVIGSIASGYRPTVITPFIFSLLARGSGRFMGDGFVDTDGNINLHKIAVDVSVDSLYYMQFVYPVN